MSTSSKTLIAEPELQALGQRAFEALGLPPGDAGDVVQVLLLADLFGLSTHGLSRIESYGERLDMGASARLPASPSSVPHRDWLRSMAGTAPVRWWACMACAQRWKWRTNAASARPSFAAATTSAPSRPTATWRPNRASPA